MYCPQIDTSGKLGEVLNKSNCSQYEHIIRLIFKNKAISIIIIAMKAKQALYITTSRGGVTMGLILD